jgi:hypothetical protein
MLSTATLRRLALVAAAALVAGAAVLAPAVPAQAADATVQVQGPTEVLLSSSAVPADFSVTINGTVTDYQASIQVLKKTVKKPVLPTVASKPALTLAQALPVSLTLGNTVSPGRYQLTVQALNGTAVVATAVAVFVVEASADSTWSQVTKATLYGHFGRSKLKFVWVGPAYLKGARVTVYYQKPGRTTYSKIGSKKINSKGKTTVKTKRVTVVDGAPWKVTVADRPFAAGLVSYNHIGQGS